MEQTYEEWEALNEVMGRYPINEVEEMAKRIVELEAEVVARKEDVLAREEYIEKREEYVEFLFKELGDTQHKLDAQVTCLTDMLIDRHTDEETIEDALADCLK